MSFEGGCLCGQVRYTSNAAPITTVHCCCTDCRRIGGTGHATHTVVTTDAFECSGVLTEYEKVADSGNRINRRFCPTCGSAIFHTRDGLEGMVVLRTSSLDDPEAVKPERVLYTGSAVSWDVIDRSIPAFEKMSRPPTRR
ncbi:GFA family protein [Roseibium album]|uniref:GFA family protein n=1 Tax=Roseibium album TaxID=311410 RepID=UPI00391BCEC1